MDDRASAPARETQDLIGGRYRLEVALGRGGTATVYAALDTFTGERLALKRLRATDAANARRTIAQFRHEYELLTELCHPSIIRAYDYGLDAGTPYYTMELLDGENLAERGQLPWREACLLLRDIASSLAVLHARKLAHRDVTLRNIHSTRSGRCKLLDFGAVAPMGNAPFIIGTPPYVPPEALNARALDARTDLFAFGAALYYLLVGRHAYAATRIEELELHWTERPPYPHELVPATPLALSQLTMALLSLDPLARPHSAAEVMDRLSALSGLDLREPGAVRRSYLARPALVGRTRAVQQVRLFVSRTAEQRGGVLAIVGPVGSGRTRMLDVCATQARLSGCAVVQIQAKNPAERCGLLRTLVREVRKHAPARGECGAPPSELLASTPAVEPLRRRELQDATAAWLAAVAAGKPLMIAIDDLDRADEPSLACLAAASEQARDRPLLIAFTAALDRPAHAQAAYAWLSSTAASLELPSLTRHEVLELLSTVFGDVPNTVVLADRLHRVSGGQPRWIMQLAEDLVDSGVVRYEAGAFRIPERLSIDALPDTLAEALQHELARASAPARELAQAFTLAPDAWFSPDELATCTGATRRSIEAQLEELVAARVVVRDGTGAGLCHQVWIGGVGSCDRAAQPEWHARLAALFSARDDTPRAIQHTWSSGARQAAAAMLVEFGERLNDGMRSDPALLDRTIAGLSPEFMPLLCEIIEHSPALGVTRRGVALLRLACVRIGALTSDPRALPHVRALLAELRVHAGLEAWEHLAQVEDPAERLSRAMAAAQARFDAAAPSERCFAVPEAIRLLSVVNGHAVGLSSQAREFELIAELPSLAPLVPLSATLGITQMLTTTVTDLMAGRYQRASAGYLRMLEHLDGPGGAAIDPPGRRFNRLGSYFPLGLLAAERGQEEALVWADKLERELLFEIPAWRVRMTLHRIRGEVDEAERCRRQAELLRIAQRPYELYGTGAIAAELVYCVATEDVVRIKRVMDELESIVRSFPNWQPMLLVARGEYARMRGEHSSALGQLEAALACCECGRDSLWLSAAAAYLSTLHALGQLARARELGRSWVLDAEAADLREAVHPIAHRLALVEAALGDRARAESVSDGVLRDIAELQIEGIRAGIAHETRARVALLLGDRAGYERHVSHCASYFCRGQSGALRARYSRLVRDARALGLTTDESLQLPAAGPSVDRPGELERCVRSCANALQRGEAILHALCAAAGANAGALYVARSDGMALRAVCGGWMVDTQLEHAVEHLWTREADVLPASPDDETRDAPMPLPIAKSRAYLLAVPTGTQRIPVAVALLREPAERWTEPSPAMLERSAKLLLEAGDATSSPVERGPGARERSRS